MSLRLLYMYLTTPIACVIGLWRPFYGLLCLIFLYYFRPDIWNMPGWFRPIQWITISVGIGWIARTRTIRFNAIMGFSLFLLLAQLASAIAAHSSQDEALSAVNTISKLMIVQWLTLQLVDTPKKLNQFLWANIFGMLWNMKIVMVVGLRGGGGDDFRVNVAVGQGGGANYLAMIFVMFMPFLFLRWQSGARWEKRWALFFIPVVLLCIVFTGSRGGLLALGCVLIHGVLRSRRKFLGLVLAALSALFVWQMLPEGQKDRFAQGVGAEGKRDFASESRILLWKGGVNMFRDRPLLGVGPDNFPILSPKYAGFYASKNYEPYIPGKVKRGFVAHSTWAQTLAEGGILSIVPLLTIVILCFVAIRSARKDMGRDGPEAMEYRLHCGALEGLMIAMVVGSTFGSHIKLDPFWWYIGAMSALGTNASLAKHRASDDRRWQRLQARVPAPPRLSQSAR